MSNYNNDILIQLEELGVEYKNAGKEILIYCPYCHHHNQKLSINKESGAWRCFVCNEKGPAAKLLSKLEGIQSNLDNSEEPKPDNLLDNNYLSEMAQYYSRYNAPLYDKHTYLKGVAQYSIGNFPPLHDKSFNSSNTPTFNPSEIQYNTPNSLKYLVSRGLTLECKVGYYRDIYNNESIVFPLYNPLSQEETGYKFKRISGQGSPYRMEGQHPGLYIPNKHSFQQANSIVLVEGEIDSLTVEQWLQEIPNTKVQEMTVRSPNDANALNNAAKDDTASCEETFNNKINNKITVAATTGATNHKCVPLLKKFESIYLFFDNDQDSKVRENVIKSRNELATKLRHSNPNVKIFIIDLNDLSGQLDYSTIKDANDLLVQQNFSGQEFSNLIESAVEYLDDQVHRSANFYVNEMFAYLSDNSRSQGEPTLMDGLDHMLGGGKRLGEISVLQAMAKTGKNTLWHQLMYLWLEAGIPIAYASRELAPGEDVLPNLLSIHFGKNFWKEGTQISKEEVMEKINSWPLYFAEGYGIFDYNEIERWVKELKAKGIAYFWIDHFHFCLADSENPKEIAMFARKLKTLVKKEQIHLDLIVQPKYVDEDRPMGLQTLRGGAAIGQAIDNLFVLERYTPNGEKNISKLTLKVARHKLARPGSMLLQYNPETTMMNEAEEQEDLDAIVVESGKSFQINE